MQATIAFSFRNESYPADVYSAYKLSGTGELTKYCLRYEVQNKGSNPIKMLSWPLAGLQATLLPSNKRIGLPLAIPGAKVPVLNESPIEAFLNSSTKANAYQPQTSIESLSATRIAANNKLDGLFVTQADLVFPTRTLSKPSTLPKIGAQFSIDEEAVTSTSEAKWTGESLTITFAVTRTSEKFASKITAPVTYALYKGYFGSNIGSFLSEVRNVTLPIVDNSVGNTISVPMKNNEASLFVVMQPITLYGADETAACFLAPTYFRFPKTNRSAT